MHEEDEHYRPEMVFYHLFMAIVYGGIGVLIGVLVF